MYKKEFFAESLEDARATAATHFEVEADKLEIVELEMAAEGLGDRKCYVAHVKGTENDEPPPRPEGEGRGRDRGRDRDRGRGRDRDRGRGRDRDRGRGRGDRDRRPRRPRGEKPEGVDHERLEALAKEAAEHVQSSGESLVMEPMNSKERWVVHNYIKGVGGLTSLSVGEGDDRRVKVVAE